MKPFPGIMSADEIKDRLETEDPLDLSIEAWFRKLQYLHRGYSHVDLNLGFGSCPLCEKYWWADCVGCALAESGQKCFNKYSAYFHTKEVLHNKNSTKKECCEAAGRMIRVMRRICMKCKIIVN